MSTHNELSPLVPKTILGVVREAMRERDETRLTVLRSGTPGHDLVVGWLREDGLAPSAAQVAPDIRTGIVLDPVDKLTLLLAGPLPGADLLPLGDVWPSALGAEVASPVERALRAVFDEGRGLAALVDHLPLEEATDVRRALLRTAPLLRPPTVPKLGPWTVGIDPGL